MTIICDDERARGAARNVRDALAVLRPFMYAMRWRTNVSYALAVRTMTTDEHGTPTVNSGPKAAPSAKRLIVLSETIVLAALPLLSYALIFTYSAGYLRYFGLPLQFIEFSIVEVFIVMAVFLPAAFALFYVTEIALLSLNYVRVPDTLARRLAPTATAFVPGIILITLDPSHPELGLLLVAPTFAVILVILILPFVFGHGADYKGKVDAFYGPIFQRTEKLFRPTPIDTYLE